MDERLSSYALIARAAVDITIPLLMRLFSERVARLNQVGILYGHEALQLSWTKNMKLLVCKFNLLHPLLLSHCPPLVLFLFSFGE